MGTSNIDAIFVVFVARLPAFSVRRGRTPLFWGHWFLKKRQWVADNFLWNGKQNKAQNSNINWQFFISKQSTRHHCFGHAYTCNKAND